MGHTLMAAGVFFLAISAVGFLCAALDRHRYEECLPAAIFGIILVLYVSGLFHGLEVGTWLVLGITGALYPLGLALAIAKRRIPALLKNFFTPCFALFLGLFLFLIYCDQGLLAYHTDDFSHWTDILRVMTQTHGFGVSASARSYFGTYPPAISLIEYFFVSIGGILFPSQPFSEHLIYLAYQLTAFSLFLPFLHRLRGKPVLYTALFSLGCFIVPLTLHGDFFFSLYADPMLGLLAGFCFIYPQLRAEGLLGRVTFLLALFTLTLTKGVGVCLALLAAVAFLLTQRRAEPESGLAKANRRALWQPIAAFAVILVSYLSWQALLWANQPLFSEPWAGGNSVFQLLAGGGIQAYQKTAVGTFADRLFVVQYSLGGHGQLGVCFLFLFALLLLLLALLLGRLPALGRGQRRALLAVSAATVLLYMAGLCYAYMFQFSPEEAEYLHSFARYGAVPLTLLLTMLFGALCLWLEQARLTRNTLAALLALFVLAFPYEGFRCLFKHEKVIQSQAARAPYDQLAQQVLSSIPQADARVYLISQEPDFRNDFWFLRSLLRPLVMDNHNYFISPEGVLGPEGIRDITKFTSEQSLPTRLNAQEWQTLLAYDYDYVLLFQLDDAFAREYAPVFLEPETIREGALYRVQDDGGLEHVPMGE